MVCIGFSYVIVESYHPETKSANFFLVRKDELLLSVLKEITDSILNQTDRWDYFERRAVELLGEKLTEKNTKLCIFKDLENLYKQNCKITTNGQDLPDGDMYKISLRP